MKTVVKNYPTISFFVFALTWSGGIWLLLIPTVQHALGFNIPLGWQWLGLPGPGVAAIVISIITDGTPGLKKLFKPLLVWQVPYIYYVVVYLGVFFFYCAASWISAVSYNHMDFHSWRWLLENVKAPFFGLTGIWVLIEITIIYTVCEELGWRGFALPNLIKQMNGLSAALLIGLIWTIWHVPLVYLNGSHFTSETFIFYTLHIVCMSIFYAWLYFKTGKSLLLVGLFHGTTDGIGAFFPITASTIGQGPNFPTLFVEIIVAILMIPYLWKFSDKTKGGKTKGVKYSHDDSLVKIF